MQYAASIADQSYFAVPNPVQIGQVDDPGQEWK
jgi:hypothetical protein